MRATLESWIHKQWAKRSLLTALLSPFSLVFLAAANRGRKNTKPQKLPVPVIVIGNIYVGGTGKTPVTIALAKALQTSGWHPGIISRGYGRQNAAPRLVKTDSPAGEVGDEPLLIARLTGLPVAVGSARYDAGRLLLEEHPAINVIISDDGLQHYALYRDMEIIVVGARGLGNGWVLPAGPLREPPSRLDEADAIVLNSTTQTFSSPTPRFATSNTLGEATSLDRQKTLSLDDVAHSGKSVLAAAGIAAPERFFNMLPAHDIQFRSMELGDHYAYDSNPFKDAPEELILITEKDAVKCRQRPDMLADPRIYSVNLVCELDPLFIDFVTEKLQKAQK